MHHREISSDIWVILTYFRRRILYFELYYLTIAIWFHRLHEFDEQVHWVREGMARVVPVPLLSLFTGYELETMVGILFYIFFNLI